jgi:hypothetical protein
LRFFDSSSVNEITLASSVKMYLSIQRLVFGQWLPISHWCTMNHNRGFAGFAENRPEANRPLLESRPANGGNVIVFPINRTRQYLEAVMLRHGDDAGDRDGLSAQGFPEAPADRATYRKWILGMVVVYCTLLLISGVVAITTESSSDLTRLTSLSAHATAASPGSH